MERSTRSGKVYKRKSTASIEPTAKRPRMNNLDTGNIHEKTNSVSLLNSFFCFLSFALIVNHHLSKSIPNIAIMNK